jgi:hypothetical protein
MSTGVGVYESDGPTPSRRFCWSEFGWLRLTLYPSSTIAGNILVLGSRSKSLLWVRPWTKLGRTELGNACSLDEARVFLCSASSS